MTILIEGVLPVGLELREAYNIKSCELSAVGSKNRKQSYVVKHGWCVVDSPDI
jgi:hypothetical protein